MLDIPALNTAAGQRSFIYRAVKCWNILSVLDVRKVQTKTSAKHEKSSKTPKKLPHGAKTPI